MFAIGSAAGSPAAPAAPAARATATAGAARAERARPADTVPADDAPGTSSGDGGYVPHPHVRACFGHHIRVCS